MSQRLSGNALYAQAITGLRSSYYYLMQGVANKGLSLQDIISPSDEAKKSAYMNYSFSSYLANNFTKIDMDGDGMIGEEDLTNYTSQMCTTGLTYSQLAQLCSQGGTSSLLETVLNNFNEIDRNKDGRVTNAEISAYGIEQEADEVKNKYPKFDLNGMSIYYETSASSKHEDTKET